MARCARLRNELALRYSVVPSGTSEDGLAGQQAPLNSQTSMLRDVLPEAHEVRLDRGFPINGCRHAAGNWSIHIDNLDFWELFD